jgi:hypothetical protein
MRSKRIRAIINKKVTCSQQDTGKKDIINKTGSETVLFM